MPRKKSGLFDPKEYVNRYHRESIARMNVTFNRGKPEDMVLLEWAKAQPGGFVAYVKKLIRKDMGNVTYKIRPEYLDLWEGGDTSDPDRIITESDVEQFAREWDKTPEELKEQLTPVEP
jgi:hypothetical protein